MRCSRVRPPSHSGLSSFDKRPMNVRRPLRTVIVKLVQVGGPASAVSPLPLLFEASTPWATKYTLEPSSLAPNTKPCTAAVFAGLVIINGQIAETAGELAVFFEHFALVQVGAFVQRFCACGGVSCQTLRVSKEHPRTVAARGLKPAPNRAVVQQHLAQRPAGAFALPPCRACRGVDRGPVLLCWSRSPANRRPRSRGRRQCDTPVRVRSRVPQRAARSRTEACPRPTHTGPPPTALRSGRRRTSITTWLRSGVALTNRTERTEYGPRGHVRFRDEGNVGAGGVIAQIHCGLGSPRRQWRLCQHGCRPRLH